MRDTIGFRIRDSMSSSGMKTAASNRLYAWMIFQRIPVPKKDGTYRYIPGLDLHYSGDFPLWRLSYFMVGVMRDMFEQFGMSFQALFRVKDCDEIPFMAYEKWVGFISDMTAAAIVKRNWQSMIDSIWNNRTPEDYSEYYSRVKTSFEAQWSHSRTSVGRQMRSLEEMLENDEGDIIELAVADENDYAEEAMNRITGEQFLATLPGKDQTILQLKRAGYTNQEIAEAVGYKTHSAVVKRMKKIAALFEEFAGEGFEAGKVGVCLSKDLSRLGRNSAMVGLYINITFAKYGVRYIAINDNFDTIDPNSYDNDLAGIKNWFNEFYARDTSRKIRAVNKAKGERGDHLSVNPPYGYRMDPDDPKKWIIDEEAAAVVKDIFRMCMEGRGPGQIATELTNRKVLTPSAYHAQEGRKIPQKPNEYPYYWHSSTVVTILERRDYTGCTVNFKTYTNSIWDKKVRFNSEDKQAVFPGTQPVIIEPEVFEKVQEIRQSRHRRDRTGRTSLLSGLVYCMDCGGKMYYCGHTEGNDSGDFFTCYTNRKNNEKCTHTHYIRATSLETVVMRHLKMVISYVSRYEQHFRSYTEQKLRLETAETLRILNRRLSQKEKRVRELDGLFICIYEDNASGKISDDRFFMISKTYEDEQAELKEEISSLQEEIEVQERQIENLERFIQTVRKYEDLDKLTPYAARELIKAIHVGRPDKSNGKRRQEVRIEYDFIGYIPLDELLKEVQA